MRSATIRRGQLYALLSYGNGTAYDLRRLPPLVGSVFVQGDDAVQLNTYLDQLEMLYPELDTDALLRLLWDSVEN